MGQKRNRPEQAIRKLPNAKVLVARWRRYQNAVRPHRALGYRPPAPEDLARVGRSGHGRGM